MIRFAALLLLLAGAADVEARQPPRALSTGVPGATVDSSWSVRTLDGERVSLGSLRGRVVFINAWASWCTPCVREMASLEGLRDRVRDVDVAFLLVAVEGEGPVRRHLRRYPVDLPIYLEDERFPSAFGLRGIPMSWVLDGEGRIRVRHFGAAEWDDPGVERVLRALAAPAGPGG